MCVNACMQCIVKDENELQNKRNKKRHRRIHEGERETGEGAWEHKKKKYNVWMEIFFSYA